jgi:hypothetical protein
MHLELLRELQVDPALHPRGQRHLSSASGLALVGRSLVLAADDEHHLGLLDLDRPSDPVQLLRVVEGDLPADAAQRKRRKRDFEAVARVRPHAGHPHGALLVFGSASRAQRQHVLRVALDAHGRPAPPVQAREAGALLEPLRARFADLNIEGAFELGDALCLLQRGNLRDPRSACIRLPLQDVLRWMDGDNAVLPMPHAVEEHLLDAIDGVPLAFTDGAALADGGWVFSAVAEATDDSYADGACVASAVGRVAPDGTLQVMEPLAGAPKVEGLALAAGRLLLVTDADDPAVPSRLLAGTPAWLPAPA